MYTKWFYAQLYNQSLFFFFFFIFPSAKSIFSDTVHIKECPCNRTSHTACNRGIIPCQPCLFQISQLFHTSPFINSQVSMPCTTCVLVFALVPYIQHCRFILTQNLTQSNWLIWLNGLNVLPLDINCQASFLEKNPQKNQRKNHAGIRWGVYVLTPFFICQTWGTDMEPGTFWQHPLWLAGNYVIIRGDQ